MPRPASPRRPIIVGVTLLMLSTALLIVDRRPGRPGAAGRFVSRILGPLEASVTTSGRAVRTFWTDYVGLIDVRAQNAALESELRELRQRTAESDGLRAENERLRTLLELADQRKDLRLRAARVVSRGLSSFFRVLRLTLDVDDPAVQPGQPVLAPGGLVGQIRTVSGTHAEVLLVTDPRSSVDVMLETSRVRGVAVGTGEPDRYAARLEYLERSEQTVRDERVLTTGDDGRYPRGLVVGRVTSVKSQPHGLFQNAEVEPLADLSGLDEVFIVIGPTGLTSDGLDLERPDSKGSTPSLTPGGPLRPQGLP